MPAASKLNLVSGKQTADRVFSNPKTKRHLKKNIPNATLTLGYNGLSKMVFYEKHFAWGALTTSAITWEHKDINMLWNDIFCLRS